MSKLRHSVHLMFTAFVIIVFFYFFKIYALPQAEKNSIQVQTNIVENPGEINQKDLPQVEPSFSPKKFRIEPENYTSYVEMTIFAAIILLFVYIAQKYFLKIKSSDDKYISENRKYLVLLYNIIFLSITLIITWITLNQVKSQIIKRTGSEIETVLASTNEAVNIWIENELKIVTTIASNPDIVELTEKLLDEPLDPKSLTTCSAQYKLRETMLSHYGNIEYYIINPASFNIGAFRATSIGKENFISPQRPKILKEVFKGNRAFIPPVFVNLSQHKNPVQLYCAPIKSKTGKIIAAIAFTEDPEKTFAKIVQINIFGKSGEAFLFDSSGVMISKCRHEDTIRKLKLIQENESSILNLKLLAPEVNLTEANRPADIRKYEFTFMIKNALCQKCGINLSGYKDHRGVFVFGAWKWTPKYNLGIAVEIDKQEALSTYYLVRNIVIAILSAIIVLGMFFSVISIRLTEKANRLLFKYNQELEDTVNTRTSELKNRETELVEQKEMLLTTINSLPHPFYVVNINDYSIALSNDAAQNLINKNIKNTCYALSHNATRSCGSEEHPCPIDEIKKTNKPVIVEHKHYDRNDNPCYVEVYGYPIFDKTGKFVQMIEYSLDITERKKHELEVKKLSTVVEQSPVAIVITDKAGNIEYVNHKFCETSGYSESEIIGQSPVVLNSGKLSTEFFKELWETILSGENWYGELCNIKKNGEEYWVRASIAPITDNKGQIINFVAVKEDITKQKELQQRLEKSKTELRVLIDNIEAIVYLKDINGKYLIVNKHFEQLTQMSLVDIIGKTNAQVFSPELAQKFIEEDKQIYATGKPLRVEDKIVDNDGKVHLFLSIKALLKDENGSAYGICGIATDITYQKEIERYLREAKKKAEEAARIKSDFLANMSHEIRTPMNAVLGLNYLLQKSDLNAKQLEYTKKIEGSAKNLLRIINDILDFSKIEAGKLDIEEVDFNLNDVLERISCMMNIKAQEKDLQLIITKNSDVPVSLIGDPLRIEQVLINLIANAIKFTEKGSVKLKVERIKLDGRKLIAKFSVQDTGIGLTENQKENLFKSFQQADTSTTRKYGGTGLGLSISKRLVEMMKGEIGVESVYEKGSTFYFSVCLRTSKKHENCIELLPDTLRGIHVLTVEDKSVLKDCCDKFSFKTTTTATDEKAVNILENDDSIKIVFIDWDVPGLNGAEISKKIKNSQKIKQKPKIIIITDSEQCETINKLGIDGCVTKPVNQSTILDFILEAFGEKIFTRNSNNELSESADLDSIKNSRILLVEDNMINQQVAAELLGSNGLIVDIVGNGQTAVDMIRKNTEGYDMVLMDLQMPVMDGYTATKLIRKDKAFDSLPVIAMSADVIGDIQGEVLNAGMNDFVAKPVDVDKLFNTLLKWIKPKKTSPKEKLSSNMPLINNNDSITLPEISGINTKDGLKRVAGNKKLYLQILSQFAENHLNFVPELLDAIDCNDKELAIREAHSFKSVTGNIGATELYESVKNLEALLKNKFDSGDVIKKQLNNIDHFVKTTIKELEKINIESYRTPSQEVTESLNITEVKSVISELKNSIDQYNANSLIHFEELQNRLNGYKYDTELDDLRKTINNFDFANASRILNSLTEKLFS